MILEAGSRGWAAQVAVGQGRAGGERWPRQAPLRGSREYLWEGKNCLPNIEAET